MNGLKLELVEDPKYLGSWCSNSQTNISARKSFAWQAWCKLSNIWKSTLLGALKVLPFTAVVEFMLLYGCEAWMMMKSLEKQLDGCHT